jgi:hypothetical protein
MKKSFLTIAIALMCLHPLMHIAQVGINTTGATPDPSSMLDVNSSSKGVLIPRMTTSSRIAITSPAKGLLVYDSSLNNFWFHNGTSWNELISERFWSRNSATGSTYLTNINDWLGIGIPVPGYPVHIVSANILNDDPVLMVSQTGTGDASASFFLNPGRVFTIGYDNSFSAFKISDTAVLTGIGYHDRHTMISVSNINPGIVHVNHQSRARAWLAGVNVPPVGQGQLIPAGMWIQLHFDNLSFSSQNEMNVLPGQNQGAFTVKEEGYYQVNARTQFAADPPVNPNSFVSIAIFVNGQPRAMGNRLSMYDEDDPNQENNAPVVADILHLQPGDVVTIRVFQTYSGISAICVGGAETTYFSIHKLS